jgi:hypothetical protein
VILHKDTPHPHVHLVVNRIGPEKHFMDSTDVLKQVDHFCREAEIKYQLTQVEGMRRYRLAEDRFKPSQGHRVVQLREAITQTLQHTQDLASFKEQMQNRGYNVHKTERGVSFTNGDHVFLSGSKVGYPWKKIEAELAQNLAERQAHEQRLEQDRVRQLEIKRKQELTEEDGPEPVQRRGLRMRM